MHLTSGSQMPDTFKPYVYRGWGYDLFPEEPVFVPTPPKRKRKPRVTKPKPAPRKYHWDDPRHPTYWERFTLGVREDDEPKPKAEKHKPKRTGEIRPSVGWKPLTGADVDDMLSEYMDE